MTGTLIDTGIPKVEQYMSETGKAYNLNEISEFLEVTNSAALGILDLMIAFGIVQKVKRRVNYYFLKDVYSDEQITAMLPPEKAPRVPKPRGRPRGRPRKIKLPTKFLDKYLDPEKITSQGAGLPALALLGVPRPFDTLKTGPKPSVEMVLALMGEESNSLINSRPFATVKYLPKDVRRLSPTEARYLKNQLKGLGEGEWMDDYNTVFSKWSALKYGRYGEVIYFSKGSNSWDNVRKVTVDSSISDCLLLPTIETDRWSQWNAFLAGLKETRRYSTFQYDEMFDRFMESGHKLVEITVENRGTAYVKNVLKRKIMERDLMDQVKASRVGEWIYLEKTE